MTIIERGDGPPLVLIPGLQGRWEYVRPTVDALSQYFRVLSFSLCDEPTAKAAFDPQRIARQPLAVLPDPMRVDRGDLARRGRGHVREHRERNIEVIVRVRAPGEPPIAAHLRDPHRPRQRPEMHSQIASSRLHAPLGSSVIRASGYRQASAVTASISSAPANTPPFSLKSSNP